MKEITGTICFAGTKYVDQTASASLRARISELVGSRSRRVSDVKKEEDGLKIEACEARLKAMPKVVDMDAADRMIERIVDNMESVRSDFLRHVGKIVNGGARFISSYAEDMIKMDVRYQYCQEILETIGKHRRKLPDVNLFIILSYVERYYATVFEEKLLREARYIASSHSSNELRDIKDRIELEIIASLVEHGIFMLKDHAKSVCNGLVERGFIDGLPDSDYQHQLQSSQN